MNLLKRIIGFTVLILTLLLSAQIIQGAELKDYTVGNGVITVISKTADGTVLETKTPELTAGDMAKLTAKQTITNDNITYTFSHFEYHTSARDYVASYDNPMDLYVDPPMTIYAVYTNGSENTTAYVSGGATGFYKDPVTDGTNTYLFCSVAGTDNLESTEIKAVLSAANSVALEGTTMETVTINNNTETSTTKLFSKEVKSMQFIVAAPIASAINAEILAENYTNIGRTKTWDLGSAAFSGQDAGPSNVTINGLTFSKIPGTPYKETEYTFNNVKYTRGLKLNTNATISFDVTKGDIIEIYGIGNQTAVSTLSVTNTQLKSGTGNLGTKSSTNLSLNTYVATATGTASISFTDNNGYFYCIKVNPINPTIVETQSTTTTNEQATETTTAEITQDTTQALPDTSVHKIYVLGSSANSTEADAVNVKSVPYTDDEIVAIPGANSVNADHFRFQGKGSSKINYVSLNLKKGDVIKVTVNSSSADAALYTDKACTTTVGNATFANNATTEFTIPDDGIYYLSSDTSSNSRISRIEITRNGSTAEITTEATTKATVTTEATTKAATTSEATTETTTKTTTTEASPETTTYTPDSSGSKEIHNFTKDGIKSEFYTITGNLATNKGTVTYNGLTLTQCLKMESSTNITFKNTAKGKLTLVFVETSGNIKIDGTAKTIGSDGILEIELEAGTHTITKGTSINLFYMVYEDTVIIDPTKGHINAAVKNLNGNTVFDAVVNANTTSLTYNSESGLYIGTNLEPGTYTVTATKTINGNVYSDSKTVEITANSTAAPELTLNYGTGNISVSVINISGTSITKANVTAVSGSEAITLKYDSSSGTYTANDVTTGSYTVTAEMDSVSDTANVTVAQGQTATAEINLDIDPNAYIYIDIQDQLSQPFNTTDTTTVTNYADLQAALTEYNASSSGGTIYIDAPKIECEGQLRITGKNISLIGVIQEELSTDKYKVFPVLDFSKFRASAEGINASDPLAITKGSDTDAGIRINGNYNLIQNLIVEKAPDNGIQLKAVDDGNNAEQTEGLANYNIIENCIARYNNDTGIQVSAPMPLAGTGVVEKASYNSFKWCYSYRNCDVYTFGGNADGFAPKLNTRTGNVFDHCYAWDNSDDGWDAFDKSASSNNTEKGAECDADVTADITYKNSACWNNGNREVFSGVYDQSKGYPVDTNLFVYEILSSQNVGYDGTNFSSVAGNASINTSKGNVTWSSWYTTANSEMNGNGFKFGSDFTPKATSWQYDEATNTKVYEMKRVLENCLSFDHKSKGFDNNNTSGINGYFTNTVSFDNKYNYYFSGYKLPVWTNALGFSGSSKDSLPSGFSATTPSSAIQTEIREEVADKSWRIFEACQANVIPGGAEFNIYN